MTPQVEGIAAGSSPLARGTHDKFRDATGTFGLIPARAGNTGSSGRTIQRWRAHPRSRGEHRVNALIQITPSGSSPLARGTRVLNAYVAGSVGLIPARAGNTYGTGECRLAPGAHPRSRGEHNLCVCCATSGVGSSPLARGTLCGLLRRIGGLGLIPARAGNTTVSSGG